MTAISAYNTARMPEKLFIHTDKWNYNKGDTLWFKTYVFDATMAATTKTGLMYIEITNANNLVVNRNMVSLTAGTGWGNIALKPERYPEGTYTMRAYTNWMRNFDGHYIFSRQFTIEGALDEDWMINSRFDLTEKEGVNNIKSNLTFVKDNGNPMFAEQLEVIIDAGKRRLYRTKLNTGVSGSLDFNFNLPERVSANDINITIYKKTKEGKEVTFNVPVIINRDEKTDVQFMPEGGNMVNGLNNRIAFKAINEEGKGVEVSGGIYNSKGQKITDIATIHRGMGTFDLKPELNETYTARITNKGKELSFTMPAAKPSGLVMNIDNISNKDSVIITVTPSANITQAGAMYYLIAQSRNVVCYGANVNTGKSKIRLSAPHTAFPTGVARFTLLSQQDQPVAERIIYVDHHDQIRLSITPSKQIYTNRDSVNLELTAIDKDGAPVEGSFSLAVTDNAQARPDTSGYYDLPAKVLLADDLKGNIENPGWYFSAGDILKKAAALDALMLTQGWVNYNWQDVFSTKPKHLAYIAESEFVIKGKVINTFSKVLKRTSVLLMSVKPPLILEAQTNEAGEFAFTGLTPPDTVKYLVQAKNKRGKAFNVGAKVEEFVPPVFTSSQQRVVPLYVNIDTSRLVAIRTKQLYDAEEEKVSGTKLKEVIIKAKKIVKDSKSILGPEEGDFVLDEIDIKAMSKVTLLEILKKVPGFELEERFKKFGEFTINGKYPIIIIDGIPAGYAADGLDRYQLLNYVYNDDIKGIEVMMEIKKVEPYVDKFGGPPPGKACAIEITTYSGKGIFKKPPGTEVYQPPIFAAKKEFYSPLYTVKKPNIGVDNRATIFWAPNVVTDEKGKAIVGFYTADKTATYTVNMQGADMWGQIGTQQIKVNIKADNSSITAK